MRGVIHGRLATVLTAAVVVFIGVSLVWSLQSVVRHERLRQDYRRTVMAIRWWMVPAAVGQLTVVIAVYVALVNVFPLLGWGWWRMLGNSGNVTLAQTGQSGFIWKMVGLAVPILAAAVVPWLAHAEELAFRDRAERQGLRRKVTRQVAFGMTHFWAGIPIAACLALTISGLYFLMVYLRAVAALGPELETAREVPQYERLPYPALPANRDEDPEAWAKVLGERERVRMENERRRDEWADNLGDQISASRDRVDQVRRLAVARSAAAHAVSNWVLIILLVLFLSRRALGS